MELSSFSDRRLDYRQTMTRFGRYKPCPACERSFQARVSFVSHLVTDHWWTRDEAVGLWKA